jgi:hypothetical protein
MRGEEDPNLYYSYDSLAPSSSAFNQSVSTEVKDFSLTAAQAEVKDLI